VIFRAFLLACLTIACWTTRASVIYNEVESNNDLATANLIASHDGTIIIYGSRVNDGSADYFRFPVLAGDTLTASVCCYGDPMLALFDPSGNMVIANDDWYSLMPYISYAIPTSGLWTIAVTGYPDLGFSGGGSYGWTYQATISMQRPASSEIPEPGTWGLLAGGLVGVLALRRRR